MTLMTWMNIHRGVPTVGQRKQSSVHPLRGRGAGKTEELEKLERMRGIEYQPYFCEIRDTKWEGAVSHKPPKLTNYNSRIEEGPLEMWVQSDICQSSEQKRIQQRLIKNVKSLLFKFWCKLNFFNLSMEVKIVFRNWIWKFFAWNFSAHSEFVCVHSGGGWVGGKQ